MKNNALYFPYINIPTTKWLAETLVYWDKLSAIVPYEFTIEPSRLSKRMQELTSAGLVEHILPLEYISKLKDFDTKFLTFVELWLKHNQSKNFEYTKIHIEKLGSLRDGLLELNVARNGTYPWVELPIPVANVFMEYLAKELGGLEEINATPLTDIGSSLIPSNESDILPIRNDILNDIMPIPDGKISIDDIVKFKSDYGHLTKKFRNRIQEECISIVSTDIKFREEKTNLVKQNLQNEIDEIADAMNISWKNIIYGSIAPLMGTGLSIDLAPPETRVVVGTGLAVVSTVYQGISTWEQLSNTKKEPLAYVTFTNQKLLQKFKK